MSILGEATPVSFAGNTAGNTISSAGTLVMAGAGEILLSGATAAGAQTISVANTTWSSAMLPFVPGFFQVPTATLSSLNNLINSTQIVAAGGSATASSSNASAGIATAFPLSVSANVSASAFQLFASCGLNVQASGTGGGGAGSNSGTVSASGTGTQAWILNIYSATASNATSGSMIASGSGSVSLSVFTASAAFAGAVAAAAAETLNMNVSGLLNTNITLASTGYYIGVVYGSTSLSGSLSATYVQVATNAASTKVGLVTCNVTMSASLAAYSQGVYLISPSAGNLSANTSVPLHIGILPQLYGTMSIGTDVTIASSMFASSQFTRSTFVPMIQVF